MADRSAPASILASTIKALEDQVRTALAACPARQRFELDSLRQRLDHLKAMAAQPKRKRATPPRSPSR